MTGMLDIVKEFLESLEQPYEVEATSGVHYVHVRLLEYNRIILIDEKACRLVTYLREFAPKIAEGSRLMAVDAITRINNNRAFGNFDLDMDDGEIMFKASVLVWKGQLSTQMLGTMYQGEFEAVAHFVSRVLPSIIPATGEEEEEAFEAETDEEDSESGTISEVYRQFLESKGYEPRVERNPATPEHTVFLIQHQGTPVLIVCSDDDPEYLNMDIPNLWPIKTPEDRAKAVRAALQVNADTKVTKATIVKDATGTLADHVWICFQMFCSPPAVFQTVFDRALDALIYAAEMFKERVEAGDVVDHGDAPTLDVTEILQEIPGLGQEKIERLVAHFGEDIDAFQRATIQEIREIRGVGQQLAEAIHQAVNADLPTGGGAASGSPAGHRSIRAILSTIPGLGHQKIENLLTHFGEDPDAFHRASVEELCEIRGIGRQLAEAIHAEVRVGSPDQPRNELAKPMGTITVELPGGAKMEMVWIEPGTFVMGSPVSENGRDDNEGPQHKVTLTKGFFMGKYVITQGQWKAVMGTQPWILESESAFLDSLKKRAGAAALSHVQNEPERPAVGIYWEDVQMFISRLNQAAIGSSYRLPTEAEWEYACRAGTVSPWSCGNDESQLKSVAWYNANTMGVGPKCAQRVGEKQGNPWGLFDMHGNVIEWVQDRLADYSSSAQVDPCGPSEGSMRVLRGGGFADDAGGLRSANRSGELPGWEAGRQADQGARVVMVRNG